MKKIVLLISFLLATNFYSGAQHSVARAWNEVLLEAIRNDLARPTVHARNLFHSAILMYDSWAVFDATSETVFLGKRMGNFTCDFNEIAEPVASQEASIEVLSYAMYRLLSHRFGQSPNSDESLLSFKTLLNSYGFDESISSTDYSAGSYAALGNYLASKMIEFGLQDGANEVNGYENQFYTPVNEALALNRYTDQNDIDPNRWQPLAFDSFIDQSGNLFPSSIPPFLSPEWGQVTPFALKENELEIANNGFDSYIYQNPGPPDYIQNSPANGIDDPYKWGFALVLSWSSHMNPNDPTMVDISPGAIGNIAIENFPTNFEEYKQFYNFFEGGDLGTGHEINPVTNEPYAPQLVRRSDYARVLAEFWADGPDSETPPGHWFTILNYVNDHPQLVKKFNGQGEVLNDLEWDVKTYLTLAGAMHDAAVCVWGIKGYYDYIRPISAVRYMAWKGQSTDPNLPNFDPHGLPLIPGRIEIIEENDPLVAGDLSRIGKIKVFGWRGPDFINDPDTDVAGVDWQLGTRWWPYQRGTFVTPNFAGYLSGHSTFSRAAAEVLTLVTGDEFFPGGMGTFDIKRNEFLVFEEGPTEDFTLQWATYRDASDQTSLSRIWGGIHPPIDDIRGRIIGKKIGSEVFNHAVQFFNGDFKANGSEVTLYPNPAEDYITINLNREEVLRFELFDIQGKRVIQSDFFEINDDQRIELPSLVSGIYFAKITDSSEHTLTVNKIIIK